MSGPAMFPLIFGSVFVLVGLVPIWLARRTFAKDRAISKWPRAPGTVTSATVRASSGRSKDPQGYYREYTVYQPVVQFTYTVDGRVLQGDRLARSVVSSTTRPDLSRYPAGQGVMVYYDPDDPSTGYLEVHRSTGAVFLTCFGALFVFVGVLVPTLVLSCGAA
jgi:Protein of unknown function (DUF3592)